MVRIVISASRRTDIPAFYMPWFMSCIDRGYFHVSNPFNKQVSKVPAAPHQVHSIVFWSKNFGSFIKEGYGEALSQMGYKLFFNFTVNSPHPLLEPEVPELDKRLEQLTFLCDRHSPQAIHWRFDPICFFKDQHDAPGNNLDHFETIARRAGDLGIKVCITSFVDLYRKVQRRLNARSDLRIYDPPLTVKIDQVLRMARILTGFKIQLHLCCEKEVLAALPPDAGVQAASCIPNRQLIQLFGPGISLSKDRSQRAQAGCGCGLSKDIGSYHLHPCHHNCLFCYANPASDRRVSASAGSVRR